VTAAGGRQLPGRRRRLHHAAVGDSLSAALATAAAALAEQAGEQAEYVARAPRPRPGVVLLVVVQVADVDDDDADEQLERDARDQHRQHELVEPVTLPADVQQQLEFGDLSQ